MLVDMKKLFAFFLFLVLSNLCVCAEPVILYRHTNEAAGIPERIFKDAGFTIRDIEENPAVFINISSYEWVGDTGRLGIWQAMYMISYYCPVKNVGPVFINLTTDSRVQAWVNPKASDAKRLTLAVHEQAAQNVVKFLNSGGENAAKQECAMLMALKQR